MSTTSNDRRHDVRRIARERRHVSLMHREDRESRSGNDPRDEQAACYAKRAIAPPLAEHRNPKEQREQIVNAKQRVNEPFGWRADCRELADRLGLEAVPWIVQSAENIRRQVNQRRENTAGEKCRL